MRPSAVLCLLALAASPARAQSSVDTEHIRLELSLDEAARSITGRAIETLRLGAPSKVVELDAVGLEIRSVRGDDGRDLVFDTTPRTLRVQLGSATAPGEALTITIDYAAKPRRGVYFVGPGPGRPKQARQAWSNSWPEDARYWFPCHDDLADKTTSELLLTIPKDWQAMSNGALVESRSSGRTRTWHWRTEQLHSPYLLSFVAGEYEEVQEEAAQAAPPLSYLVYRGRSDDARKTFAATREMLRFFEAETGFPYPYPKYAQSIAADFIFGGMENVSATTLTDSALLGPAARLDTSSDAVIAHELAHQWWGDTLTERSWDDVWLSEGFATFFADLWREHAEGADAASYARLTNADRWLELDAEQRRLPVIRSGVDDPNALLSPNVYEKGSLVLGMLRQLVGEAAFRRGTQAFLGRFAFRSASTADFELAMEQAAGFELGWFFDQWLRQPGVPDLTIAWHWDAEGKRVVLTVRQAIDDALPARPFQLPVDVRLLAEDGSGRSERLFVERAEQEFSIPAQLAPRSVLFDSGAQLLARLHFEKPVDERAFDLTSGAFGADRVRAARDLGDIGGEAAIDALAGALRRERFWGVRVEAARALGEIGGAAVVPALRAGAADADPRVREAVMRALGRLSAAEVGADLLAALQGDPSELVQGEALRSLGALKAGGAYAALRQALGRESHAERIRIAALEGLARFGDLSAVPLVLEQAAEGRSLALRTAAIAALGDLGRGQGVVLGRLRRLLDDPQPPIRKKAAEVLGVIGDTPALEALRAAAAREDVPAVRKALDRAASRLAEKAS